LPAGKLLWLKKADGQAFFFQPAGKVKHNLPVLDVDRQVHQSDLGTRADPPSDRGAERTSRIARGPATGIAIRHDLADARRLDEAAGHVGVGFRNAPAAGRPMKIETHHPRLVSEGPRK